MLMPGKVITSSRDHNKQHKTTMIKEINCSRCGKTFEAKTYNAKYCKDCKPLLPLIAKEKNQVSDRARFTIFERDDFKCAYCGRSSIEDGVKLCLDHVNPFHLSHDNSIYNLVTACYDCNLCKAANSLSRDVLERIFQRNIKRNKGITREKQEELDTILNTYFEDRFHYITPDHHCHEKEN